MGRSTEGTERDVPPTTIFRTLENPRRRAVLDHLRTVGSCDVSDLTAAVVRREDVSASPQRVRASLTHSHLPNLVDAGFVHHDADGTVVPTEQLGVLDPYFALLE